MTDTRGRLDKDAARELELYMDNDAQIYRSRITPIKENLRKKIAKGNFDAVRSIDLWMYAVDDAAKKYFKEFGSRGGRWNDMFSRPTRRVVAYRAALEFMQEEGLPVSKSDWDRADLGSGSMGSLRGTSSNKLDTFTASYLETALWSSNDESDDSGGEPLDANYSIEDFSPEALKRAIRDCDKFQKENMSDIEDDLSQAGHDFWLTRNGHGAGFWDGDWPDAAAKRLTKASKSFGEIDIYVGDDGLLHFG